MVVSRDRWPLWVPHFFVPLSHVSFHHRMSDGSSGPLSIIGIQDDGDFSERMLQIAKLRHFRVLCLDGTTVDDACLAQIPKIRDMERIDLRCTKVTSVGVAKLKQSLPNTEIAWGWDHTEYVHGDDGWWGGRRGRVLYTTFQEVRR